MRCFPFTKQAPLVDLRVSRHPAQSESENTLIYVVSHDSREAAQESWGAFRADPEWQRVAEESQADGRIVTNIASVFIEATDFSPGQ